MIPKELEQQYVAALKGVSEQELTPRTAEAVEALRAYVAGMRAEVDGSRSRQGPPLSNMEASFNEAFKVLRSWAAGETPDEARLDTIDRYVCWLEGMAGNTVPHRRMLARPKSLPLTRELLTRIKSQAGSGFTMAAIATDLEVRHGRARWLFTVAGSGRTFAGDPDGLASELLRQVREQIAKAPRGAPGRITLQVD